MDTDWPGYCDDDRSLARAASHQQTGLSSKVILNTGLVEI